MKLDLTTLAQRLPDKRWFGDKDRSIASLELVDHGTLQDGDGALTLALVRVQFTEGPSALYHLTLIVEADGSFRDAIDEPQRLRAVGDLLAHGQPIKGERGVFHFSGPGLNPEQPPGGESIWALGTEQSNTSIVLDDDVILKFFRKVEPGPNPDLELSRILTNEGFRAIPAQVGEIFYEETPEAETTGPDAAAPVSIDLGIAQRFISGGREGWDFTLEQINTLLDEVHEADVPEDIPLLIEERASEFLSTIEQLGETTASLHVTLAREDFEDDLRPEQITPEDLRSWTEGTLARFKKVAASQPELEKLSNRVVRRIEAITEIPEPGNKLRVHGDYHLAQVLRVPRQWYVLDLEGEPARPLEERRAKQSPLKDVAGMLRSFGYAAHVALLKRTEPDDPTWERFEPWTQAWEQVARDRFLTAYLARAHEGRFLPADPVLLDQLLGFFELDKAIYEISYEQAARPDWVRIPLRGITSVIERGEDA